MYVGYYVYTMTVDFEIIKKYLNILLLDRNTGGTHHLLLDVEDHKGYIDCWYNLLHHYRPIDRLYMCHLDSEKFCIPKQDRTTLVTMLTMRRYVSILPYVRVCVHSKINQIGNVENSRLRNEQRILIITISAIFNFLPSTHHNWNPTWKWKLWILHFTNEHTILQPNLENYMQRHKATNKWTPRV